MNAPETSRSTTQTVAGNTFWYGLELSISVLAALLTSVPVARVIGPEKLGYFMYVQWLTQISGTLAMVGIPAATRKYMAEYLGQGERGIVWQVFVSSFRAQVYILLALVPVGTVLMLRFVEPSYRVCSLLMLVALVPRMLSYIPSNANNAAEKLRLNFPGAALNGVLAVALVNLSLWAGWGLTGVVASAAIGNTAELVLKMIMTLGWLRPVEGAGLPPQLRRRMFRFTGQSMVLMSLNIVVWDRSDLIFLKLLDKDIRQVTFFLLAFNLVEKILMLPRALSTIIGVSVMVEHGRDRAKLYRIASVAAKYALLVSVPTTLGLAAISSPLIRLLYGSQYVPAIPVLLIGAMLAVIKPLLPPVQSLMQAEERQGFLIRWGLLCAAVNVVLDVLLIPLAGAQGAMLANGTTQVLAIGGIWVKAAGTFPLQAPLSPLGRTLISGAVMVVPVWLIGRMPVPAVAQLALGIPAGLVVYLWMLRLAGVLDERDRKQFMQLALGLPSPAVPAARRLVAFLAPGGESLVRR